MATSWLHRTTARPRAAHRLVCFPHAGGSAAVFHSWAAALPAAEVHAVRYPGRADRLREPCATDLRRVAEAVAAELTAGDDRPVVLFGHSMGALAAFETALLLQGGPVAARHLVASAAKAPALRRTASRGPYADADAAPGGAADAGPGSDSDDVLTATLLAMGGTGPELLTDRALREYVLPYVRADFRMVSRYAYRPGPALDCPLTSIAAADDSHVRAADVAAWAQHTRGAHQHRTVTGGHFYLAGRPPFAIIASALDAASPRLRPAVV